MNTGYSLDDNEKIVRKINRHWIDLIPVAVSTTVLVLLIIILVIGFAHFHSKLTVIPSSFVAVIAVILLLIAAGILGVGVFVYKQNYLLLTNMHLIQVVQQGLFNRQVSQLSLARVQDVSAKRTGLAATMLNFGNVEVQSASEQEKFIFRNAPAPQELADQCLLLHEQFEANGGVAGAPPSSTTPPQPAEKVDPPADPNTMPIPAKPDEPPAAETSPPPPQADSSPEPTEADQPDKPNLDAAAAVTDQSDETAFPIPAETAANNAESEDEPSSSAPESVNATETDSEESAAESDQATAPTQPAPAADGKPVLRAGESVQLHRSRRDDDD